MLTGLDLNNIRSLEEALDCICKLLNLVETLSLSRPVETVPPNGGDERSPVL